MKKTTLVIFGKEYIFKDHNANEPNDITRFTYIEQLDYEIYFHYRKGQENEFEWGVDDYYGERKTFHKKAELINFLEKEIIAKYQLRLKQLNDFEEFIGLKDCLALKEII
jgi:hypothetical protein